MAVTVVHGHARGIRDIEDVVAELEELVWRERLGENVGDHIIRGDEERGDDTLDEQVLDKHNGALEVVCARGRARLDDDIAARLVVTYERRGCGDTAAEVF